MMNPRHLQNIMLDTEEAHLNPCDPLFVILDGAKHEDIYPLVTNSYNEYECLYRGEIPREIAEVAPYLMRLTHDSRFTDMVLQKAWEQNWGIFFTAKESLATLKSHFRKFIMAMDDWDRVFYFRFYDPNVLRIYLPTCNEKERKTFFGPILKFFTVGETPEHLHQFELNETYELLEKIIKLN